MRGQQRDFFLRLRLAAPAGLHAYKESVPWFVKACNSSARQVSHRSLAL
jgi:hypothetical protein